MIARAAFHERSRKRRVGTSSRRALRRRLRRLRRLQEAKKLTSAGWKPDSSGRLIETQPWNLIIRVMASHNIACLVLLFSAPVSGLQVPKPKSPKPKGVSQAATPLWVSSAPADFASGALELWDVLNNPRVAEVLRVAGMGPDETGEKIFESMKGDGYTSLKTVWEAEKEAPKLEALWQLCGVCTPRVVHQKLYAYLKAIFDVRCRSRRSAPPPPQRSEHSLRFTHACTSRKPALFALHVSLHTVFAPLPPPFPAA